MPKPAEEITWESGAQCKECAISAGEGGGIVRELSIPSVDGAVSSIQLGIKSTTSNQMAGRFARKPPLYSVIQARQVRMSKVGTRNLSRRRVARL